MREILFRGKRLDNGAWAQGQYLYDDVAGKGWITLSITESQNTIGGLLVYCVEVGPETVGQFTGLTKSDQKVFEGDIGWDSHRECYGVVEFQDGTFVYVWDNIVDDLCEAISDPDIGIIGNHWDNPDLLGGGL